MDEFWGIVVVLFIVLTILVAATVRIMQYYRKYNLVRHDKVLLSKHRALLKSGDIILFVAHTHGLTNSLFTSDLYSHAGMVVREGDRLWLSEATVDSLPDAEGEELKLPQCAQMNDLLRRLDNYPGLVFVMPLEKALSAEQERRLEEVARERNPYPTMGHMLLAMIHVPVKARHCMQHVAWLLDELGLAPDELQGPLLGTGFFGSSRAVTTLPGKSLGGGKNRYAQIKQLLCDLNAR